MSDPCDTLQRIIVRPMPDGQASAATEIERIKLLVAHALRDLEADLERTKNALADVYCMLIGAGIWEDTALEERCARAANEAQQAFLFLDGLTKAEET